MRSINPIRESCGDKKMLIKDICTSITDGSHNPPQGIASSSYLMLSSKNVFDDKITLDEPRFLSEEDFAKENKRTNVKCGDILLTIVGTVGRAAVVSSDLPPFTLQRSVAVLHPKEEVCSSRYLMYALRGKRSYIESHSKGVAQKGIYLKEVAGIDLPVHPKAMQEKITNRLDKLAFIIKCRQQELQKLDDLVRARFVEMFGEPVTNPKGWPVKKLKELSIQINSGNTPKGGAENYVEEGITFFRSQNVWKDRLEMDDIAYIDAETHASMKKSSLKHGDILMTKTGRINTENSSLGRAALYEGEDDKANVNGHVYFIRLKPGINNKFVLRILVSPEYRDLIRSVCVGGIDKRQLNKEHIEDFPIICPPADMVNEYIALAERIAKSKAAVQKALDQTQLLFDSLMQEYFG